VVHPPTTKEKASWQETAVAAAAVVVEVAHQLYWYQLFQLHWILLYWPYHSPSPLSSPSLPYS
jgi:hypothetical protein